MLGAKHVFRLHVWGRAATLQNPGCEYTSLDGSTDGRNTLIHSGVRHTPSKQFMSYSVRVRW